MKHTHSDAPAQPGTWISRAYLLLAVAALILTLKTCVPAAGRVFTALSTAAQRSRSAQAFSELTQRLSEGEAVQQALSGSFEILTGAGD